MLQFEDKLDQLAYGLLGADLLLTPEAVKLFGCVCGHRVAPFAMKDGKKKATKSGRLRVTCVKATGYLILSRKTDTINPG